MTTQEKQGWRIVAVLFVMWFFVWGGGLNTGAVFYTSILADFGWSRAQLSWGFALGAISAGATGPLVGWLCDRIDVRKVMFTGVAMVALGDIGLSRVHTYHEFELINVLVGAGFSAATGIPTSIVIANWFTSQRGLAMGIALAGASVGGAVMTPIVAYTIAHGGWRAAYVVVALPMLAIVIPLGLAVVRTRPRLALDTASEAETVAIEIPGLEIGESMWARSFWLLTLLQLLGASLWTALGQHFVAYLVGIGYKAEYGANALAIVFVFTTAGTLFSGPVADRLNARRTLAYSWFATAVAVLALMTAHHFAGLVTYVVLAGLLGGAVGVITPLVMIEAFGYRRLGALMGISGVFGTLGYAIGPVVTGYIFDVTRSYDIAFLLMIGAAIICAISVLACRPYEEVQAEGTSSAAAAVA